MTPSFASTPFGLSLSKPPRVLSLSKELSLSKPPRVLSSSKELSLSKPPEALSLLLPFDRLRANGWRLKECA